VKPPGKSKPLSERAALSSPKRAHRRRREISKAAPITAKVKPQTLPLRKFTLMRVELSEQQWKEIQKASGLPECARSQIEDELTLNGVVRRAAVKGPPAAQTRTELRRAAKIADKLITAILGANADARRALRGELNESRSLIEIMSSSDRSHILGALMPPASEPVTDADNPTAGASFVRQGLGMPKGAAFNQLHEQLSAVERLRVWLENTARSLPKQTKGAHKSAEANQWLVSQLDAILTRHTGKHINRSYKNDLQRYVKLCFQAVDRTVGAGSIRKAIEAYVRLKPRRSARGKTTNKKLASLGHKFN